MSLRNRIFAAGFTIMFAHMVTLPLAGSPAFAKTYVSTQASRVGKIKCWYFAQTNKIFGDCDIYVCPQGLKIDFSNQKWANLAKPPDWDLFVFNPKAKVYCRTPLKEWRARKLGVSFVRNLKPTGKNEVVAGMRTKVYDAQTIEQEKRSTRIFMMENLNLPRPVSVVLCGNDAIPELKGVPLRVQHFGGDAPGRTVETHVAKQVDVPSDFFAAPGGFRLVKKPEDVITGGISDIIEEMAR